MRGVYRNGKATHYGRVFKRRIEEEREAIFGRRGEEVNKVSEEGRGDGERKRVNRVREWGGTRLG